MLGRDLKPRAHVFGCLEGHQKQLAIILKSFKVIYNAKGSNNQMFGNQLKQRAANTKCLERCFQAKDTCTSMLGRT